MMDAATETESFGKDNTGAASVAGVTAATAS